MELGGRLPARGATRGGLRTRHFTALSLWHGRTRSLRGRRQMDGRLPVDEFEECVALAVEGCKAVAGVMRKALVAHTKALMAAGSGAGGG